MNTTDPALIWSRRQWVFWIVFLIAAQVGLVFWLGGNQTTNVIPAIAQPGVRVLPHAAESLDLSQVSERPDPTLFALVNQRGFSGPAWLNVRPFPYQLTNSLSFSSPLGLGTEELVDDFAEFLQTNLLSGDRIGDGLSPSVAQPVLAIPVVVNATILRVEGGLRTTPWTSEQPLPHPAEPILTNTPTVVRVLVNGAGMPVSAALLSGSGTATADRDALTFAKSMRFTTTTPGATAEWTNGIQVAYLVFQWHGVRWNEPAGATTAQALTAQ